MRPALPLLVILRADGNRRDAAHRGDGATQGAILVGLGVLNWTARSLPPSSVQPVLIGNLIVQALSLAVISRALMLGIVPAQNAGAVVVHTVIGAGFAYFLVRSRRTSPATF